MNQHRVTFGNENHNRRSNILFISFSIRTSENAPGGLVLLLLLLVLLLLQELLDVAHGLVRQLRHGGQQPRVELRAAVQKLALADVLHVLRSQQQRTLNVLSLTHLPPGKKRPVKSVLHQQRPPNMAEKLT